VKHGGGFVMIWAAMSRYFPGPIITLSGRIAASDYVNILGNMVDQMFFHKNKAGFQEDKSLIHTARSVQSWFEEYEDSLQHLSCPAQLPDLNNIESLWSV
jgi:hypothetical protein